MAVDKREVSKGRLQYHLKVRPGDVARYVLLPGDPGRVRRIAEHMDEAEEVAQNREFLTVTGTYKGVRVSATSTGIGCPSASIAVEELANVGAEVFIRVGTSAALQPHVRIADLIIPNGAVRNEGTSYFYVPEGFPAVPSLGVLLALRRAAESLGYRHHVGIISSDDAFYAETPEYLEGLRELGVISLDMESSAIFIVSHLRGLEAGTVNGVVANLSTGEGGLVDQDDPRRAEAIDRAIKTALEAVVILEGEREGKRGG
ncbi:MAG: nucleoside phosphorylase [Candidatus Korarchaeota archaeon]|nr:nucleoside phosphorylase [Candidatus Korarchaeota archaeon]